MADEPLSLMARLKRHHIFRVASAYAVVAYILIQVANAVFPDIGLSRTDVRIFIVIVALLFPVALVLGWMFIPPSKDNPAKFSHWQHIRFRVGSVLALIIVVLVIFSGAYLWHANERYMKAEAVAAAAAKISAVTPIPGATTVIPAKSIAVLPFVNESGDQDQLYFSDGLSDDLINALSQFAALKVFSRNSAFQFRDSRDSSATIGKLLGVAHLLEGSVQREDNEVRITATLVNAADGSTLWSQQYDKPYKDLFALQDDITQAVAGALQAKLLTPPGAVVQSDRPPSGNLAAYAAYQQGIAYYALNTEVSLRQAANAFTEATHLDTKYAAAYAQTSRAWAGLAAEFLGGSQAAHANAAARKALQTALTLDPDSSLAHQARSFLLAQVDMDWHGAATEAQRALQLAPNDAAAQFGLAFVVSSLGQNQRAVELTRQALAGDPRHAGWYEWLSFYVAAVGKLDEAQKTIDTAIALQPGASTYHEQVTMIEILRGDAKAALAAAQQEPPGSWHDVAMALALQIGPDHAAADAALQALITQDAESSAYQIAQVYALRRDPDAMFQWLDRAWSNRDTGIGELLSDPLILRYQRDPRFAAFCKKVGLPTTTDAKAMP
ncbi:MAG: hypothetical protein WBR15_07315 [Gammaproteobacteria bacterium]